MKTRVLSKPTASAQKLLSVMQRVLTVESRTEVLDHIDRGGFDITDPTTYDIVGIDVEKALANVARMHHRGHWEQDTSYAGGLKWVTDE